MTIHIATATVVKVSIGSAGSNSVAVFVRRGEVIPEGVSEEHLERLVKQGLIEEFDAAEPTDEPQVFSQADVDAAVKAASDAKDGELEAGRAAVVAEARKVAEAKAELESAQAEFESSQVSAKSDVPAKTAAAKK